MSNYKHVNESFNFVQTIQGSTISSNMNGFVWQKSSDGFKKDYTSTNQSGDHSSGGSFNIIKNELFNNGYTFYYYNSI